jgi:uncharacterized membrane protein HdeD (DUF308 family)
MAAVDSEAHWYDTWWVPMAIGVLSLIAGVLAIAWPGVTLLALALITGINLAVLSAFMIAEAMADPDPDDRALRMVLGVSGIIGGLVIIRRPGDTLLVLIIALGVWLIMAGIIEIVRAFTEGRDRRVLRLLSGLVDGIVGALILALPDLGLATLALLVGIAFVVRGVLMMAAGWRLRGVAHATARPGRTPPISPTPA